MKIVHKVLKSKRAKTKKQKAKSATNN